MKLLVKMINNLILRPVLSKENYVNLNRELKQEAQHPHGPQLGGPGPSPLNGHSVPVTRSSSRGQTLLLVLLKEGL